ncbi:pentapeptide repeat-containing protein [Nodosilinea nodulosa]|uniref:pentapeptide repeat-containing protein n=1 Tax=Nodosilinea nodulosa TaxID=416001 RepID=UPI0002ECD17B|nr:pentapeptide repeat-containing protein [Nodosilinea nodulosa]
MPRKPKAEKPREDIARIALELYHERLLLGQPGDERSDWIKAEKIVRSPIRTRLFASKRLFTRDRKFIRQAFGFIAWDIPKRFLFSLPKSEWIHLLAAPLFLAVATTFITGRIQREANQNAVLKAYFDKIEELTFEQKLLAETPNEGAIVLAQGRTVAALRELDLSNRKQLIAFLRASGLALPQEGSAGPVISFKGQTLSDLDLRLTNLNYLDFQKANLENANFKESFLQKANLERAFLQNANLKGADLQNANLKEADLQRASLEGADLRNANLEGADMQSANLKGADLRSTNLKGAKLYGANLKRADLQSANLKGASLGSANLKKASLRSADLKGATLDNVNLRGADLYGANLEGAVSLTQDQLALAKLCLTILPDGITLNPNRDC